MSDCHFHRWSQDVTLYPAKVILRYPPTHIGRYSLDSADFALRWPPDIFEAEGTTLLDDTTTDRQELLLEEAFVGSVPAQALRDAASRSAPASKSRVMDALIGNARILRRQPQKVPYYSRRTRSRPPPADPFANLINQFGELIADLTGRGYFDPLVAALPCLDDGMNAMERYIAVGSEVLSTQLGQHVSWPIRLDDLRPADQDVLLDIVELLHDHIARPRNRRIHEFCDCGWHYSDFGIETGRRLYRWRVNELLDGGNLGLRLADDGEDVGRLVSTTDEARTVLLESMIERNDPVSGDLVRYAIHLFRKRDATVDDKPRRSRSSTRYWSHPERLAGLDRRR